MSFRFAAAFGAVAILLAGAAGPALAHEDHEERAAAAVPSSGSPPGAESTSTRFELVALAMLGGIEIYIDEFATNAPVDGATVEIETPEGPKAARSRPGQPYRLDTDFVKKPGQYDLVATIQAGGVVDVLPFTVHVALDGAAQSQEAAVQDRNSGILQPYTLAALVLGGLGGLAFGRMAWGRRVGTAALLLVGLSLIPRPTLAHEGEEHGDQGMPAPLAGVLAHRLPDGSIFVPKALQRVFAIRTLVSETGAYRRAVELPGRVIPDPNASGFVQAAIGGRLSPPPNGFPRLGTPVKAGDLLAYVTPPLQAIDVSDMRQRQGELDQQIAIFERRVARYEVLAPSGATPRSQLEETKLELEGLRTRRASLDRARRDTEALTAPVDGIIADGSPVAGQVAQVNAVIFQIIDPARLWVEALSFESVPHDAAASGQTSSGAKLTLSYRGAGFADRNQSVPVHFAIEGETNGLRAGQFVTVVLSTSDERKGIAVPRTALVRNANGQDFIFDHVAAERFVARAVRYEPLDGDRVLVLAGLESGYRIVVQGAELLDHVR